MNLIEKLEKIKERYELVNQQLSDPAVVSDRKKMINLGKERSELEEIVQVYQNYKIILDNLKGNKEIIDANEDVELVEMAKMELEDLNNQKVKLEEEIKIILLPKDPNDDKSVIMEIRAGTGGEEAKLFAGDLLECTPASQKTEDGKLK